MLEASSVLVASTARAQRMHRSSTTEATGRAMVSMRRDDADERSESEEEQDEEDSKCWLGGRVDIVAIDVGCVDLEIYLSSCQVHLAGST